MILRTFGSQAGQHLSRLAVSAMWALQLLDLRGVWEMWRAYTQHVRSLFWSWDMWPVCQNTNSRCQDPCPCSVSTDNSFSLYLCPSVLQSVSFSLSLSPSLLSLSLSLLVCLCLLQSVSVFFLCLLVPTVTGQRFVFQRGIYSLTKYPPKLPLNLDNSASGGDVLIVKPTTTPHFQGAPCVKKH